METAMKKMFLVLLMLSAGTFQLRANVIGEGAARSSQIVSTEWIAQHFKDDSLVLLQVGDKAEFTAAHIPGAQFIQLADISTPRGQGLALELPEIAQLQATFEKLGVTDKSRIVIYFSKDWVTP